MQISWIDTENLNSLLARIAPAVEPSKPVAVEESPLELPPDEFGLFAIPEAPMMEMPVNVDEMPADVPEIQEAARQAQEADDEHSTPVVPEPPLPNQDAALPLSRIRDRLRSIRQRAVDAGILKSLPESEVNAFRGAEADAGHMASAHQSLSHEPAVVVATGSRRERLATFAAWARAQLHDHGGHVVVMDDAGELLWGGDGNAALVMSTMMACGAAIRTSAAPACCVTTVIRQTLASGNFLSVIPTGVEAGVLHIAVAAPEALSDEMARRLSEGLATSMRGLGSE